LIETQILPRLLAARRRNVLPRSTFGAVGRFDVEVFARALIERDGEAAFAFVCDCRDAGVDEVTLMLEVLAPAARRLGAFWEQDDCDFLDVTEGLTRLEAMLADLNREQELISPAAPALLLLTPPGETHFLGADMAAELFRREGWEAERAGPEGVRRLATGRFDAVGFSISCERLLPALSELMAVAREAAAPRRPAFLLGGALFASGGSLASGSAGAASGAGPSLNACAFDADFVAGDAAATLRACRALLERRRVHSLR
jgi:hypothetical protein